MSMIKPQHINNFWIVLESSRSQVGILIEAKRLVNNILSESDQSDSLYKDMVELEQRYRDKIDLLLQTN